MDIKKRIEWNKFIYGAFGYICNLDEAFGIVGYLIQNKVYCVRRTRLFIVQFYLSNRIQFTELNKLGFNHEVMTHKVPQELILLSLLFIIYWNDESNEIWVEIVCRK